MNDLPRIAAAFARYFQHSKLTLPKSVPRRRKAGFIARKGWLIQYRFGKDEKGEYLDFYSSHKMSGDDHQRLREDGSQDDLPTMSTWIFTPDDGDEERARSEFYTANEAVAKLLFEKGFDKSTINMALCVGLDEKTEAGKEGGEPGKKP